MTQFDQRARLVMRPAADLDNPEGPLALSNQTLELSGRELMSLNDLEPTIGHNHF